MASFRTHISFGIALGVASIFALLSFALVPTEWSFFILVALAVIIGAILPDIDSDSGLPFHITFGPLALIAGGWSFLYVWKYVPGNYWLLIGATVGAMILVWGILGAIFRKFTRHRGMVHSIPAGVLSGLLLFSLASRTGFDEWEAFLLGVSLTLGFILHLILDEVSAAVNFHGTIFIPNKALGSALKLFSKNWGVNILVYVMIGILVLQNTQQLVEGVTRLNIVISFIHLMYLT